MGLIVEPKDVDFYVIDKPWTDEEKREFSELIKNEKLHKKLHRLTKRKKEKHSI
jgi:hypothetical protein